jgi:hypothetical protein
MSEVCTLGCQYPTDQQVAMAARRVFLAAQERNTILTTTRQNTLDTRAEFSRFCQPVVSDMALFVVELIPVRPATELPTERQIPDPSFSQFRAEWLGVELRNVTRVRHRPHIRDHLDLGRLQQVEQCLHRDVGVPDGKDAWARRRRT